MPFLIPLAVATVWLIPGPVSRGAPDDTIPWSDTTQLVLTPDNVRRTIQVLAEVSRRDDIPKDSIRAHVVLVRPVLGRVQGIPPDSLAALREAVTLPMGNTDELVKRIPKLKAVLKQAGLTATEYTRVKVAWVSAYLTNQIDRMAHGGRITDAAHFGVSGGEAGPVDVKTVVGRNVVFVRTHPQLADSMKAAMFALPSSTAAAARRR